MIGSAVARVVVVVVVVVMACGGATQQGCDDEEEKVYCFHLFPHPKHRMNTVMGSSAERVCCW